MAKTQLPENVVKEINEHLSTYQSTRKNIGQTNDDTAGKGIWYDTKEFGDYEICFRFCSPNHAGDDASIYWYVVIE